MSLQGEFIAKNDQTMYLRAHPFACDQGVVQVRSGQSLYDMLLQATDGVELSQNLSVRIGGYDVPRTLWTCVRPKKGVLINVTAMPAGSAGKKILRIVLIVVIAIVAFYALPLLVGISISAGTALGLSALLVNALVPPPKPPKAPDMSSVGTWTALTGSSNQIAPYNAIPLVLGECKIFPVHAAMPYSEMLGQTSYQRLMFDLGHGDVVVSDMRIGETPIANYQDIQVEVSTTPALYSSDIFEESVSVAMLDSADLTRSTAPSSDEISLDIIFNQGLFGYNDDGKQKTATAYFNIEYRAVGSSSWLALPTEAQGTRLSGIKFAAGAWPYRVSTADKKPFAVGIAWSVSNGQYDVRVRRGTTDWGGASANNRMGDAAWSALRSIRKVNPSTTGTKKLAMRIKSSNQLSGTLQTFSCLVQQKIPVWNGSTWSANVVTLNPAWIVYWLLTSCPAISTHVPIERVDLASFSAFANFCTSQNFEVRGVLDARTTARAVIDDILANALGALTLRDGKYGIIFDDGNAVPTMAFSPLDMRNLTVSRGYSKIPHALKVRFKNPAANWSVDEIIVLDDGYSYRGLDARGISTALPAASDFETLELRMSGDAESAWKLGRFHFAQAKYRPNIYLFETDISNISVARGDMILMSHDTTDWGLGWGRVVSLVGANLVIDETVETPSGHNYSARIRKQDGSTLIIACVPSGDSTSTFVLASAPSGINSGDVVVIGETGTESSKLFITGITPNGDLAAQITCVDYDARVFSFWQNPPASITSEITGTAYKDPPPEPNIVIIISNEINDPVSDGGDKSSTVNIVVSPPSDGSASGGYMDVTDPITSGHTSAK